MLVRKIRSPGIIGEKLKRIVDEVTIPARSAARCGYEIAKN